MFFKVKNVKVLLEDPAFCRRVLSISQNHNGVVYWSAYREDYSYKYTFLMNEIRVYSMTFVKRKLKIKRIAELSQVPIEALYEITPGIEFTNHRAKSGVCMEGFRGTLSYYISFETIENLHTSTEFRLVLPVKRDNFQQKYASGPCTQSETVTEFKLTKFKYIKGLVPEPRVDSVITYIPKGNYYILFGGVISVRNLPDRIFNEYLEISKKTNKSSSENNFLRQFKFSVILSEEEKADFNNWIYFSNDVWKYHILQEKWELIFPLSSPMTSKQENQFVPCAPVNVLHHTDMKKIYYLPRFGENQSIFEFDYLTSKFAEFKKGLPTSYGIVSALDFSNNTLVCVSGKFLIGITVVCLETKKEYYLQLKKKKFAGNEIGWATFINNFNRLLLIERSNIERYCWPKVRNVPEIIIQINWKYLKKKYITPFLKKERKQFFEATTIL